MTDKTRRTRIPLSAGARGRLQVDKQIDGHVLRWINDEKTRIQRALDAGFEFVKPEEIGSVGNTGVNGGNSDLNSKVSQIVNSASATTPPTRAFLMKIRTEWYQEDQAKKEEVNRRVDDAIRGGKPGGSAIDNAYGAVKLENHAPA